MLGSVVIHATVKLDETLEMKQVLQLAIEQFDLVLPILRNFLEPAGLLTVISSELKGFAFQNCAQFHSFLTVPVSQRDGL